jgi:hypothetical protein
MNGWPLRNASLGQGQQRRAEIRQSVTVAIVDLKMSMSVVLS